ncbi:hypothetical protein Q8P09_03320 [Psychrobacter faecalis]|uniref:Uncharacterized protein n=1 Tax=Psychrobacter faecalis TaxID=180588 RepID=A0ABT9HEH0_9GAMM|nr:hypothetical protein [Psychrobacter faecalis]MDP4544108.1 hypothetical protein [Psychrobacter faecalis]
MITLDTASIDSVSDEIYSVERGSKIKVFLDGDQLEKCVYCNVTKGVAICIKRDISGGIVLVKGEIVYELVFGDIAIEHINTNEMKGGYTGVPTSEDFEVIKNALKD